MRNQSRTPSSLSDPAFLSNDSQHLLVEIGYPASANARVTGRFVYFTAQR